ncbi:N-acetylmuramate alpha-1-phosphate uridylyltransferase [soil metagenome]
MLPVALLAGGLATRLRPVTEHIPKSLVDVAGQPFILRQLDYLHSQGVRSVVLCVGHLGHLVETVVGDGSTRGLDIRYSFDGERPLGTGGAIARAMPLLGEEFFVLYGDSFLPIDYAAVEQSYRDQGKPALMTVLRNEDRWDTSNVTFRDGRVVAYDKHVRSAEMAHIDYGLGVISRGAILHPYRSGAFDLSEVYGYLATSGLLAGHEVRDRFYEIGSHAGLADTIRYFEHSHQE